jgi:hypothetical protein
MAPLIFWPRHLGWVVSFKPLLLYPQGKSPYYPLDRRLGAPQSRSERGGEEKNSQSLPGPELQIIQPVVQRYTTELSRLLLTAQWIKKKAENLMECVSHSFLLPFELW